MDDLVAALLIFSLYTDAHRPTGATMDMLFVYVDPLEVDKDHIKALETLGFDADYDDECFYSHRFGSA